MFGAGVRAHYVASVCAAPLMIERGRGLIVTTSFSAAQRAADDDRMIACMAHELRSHHVAAVSLYPGLARTEGVLRAAEHFDLTASQPPLFIGRVVAALAADPEVMGRSGRVLVAAEVAREYGVVDVDR